MELQQAYGLGNQFKVQRKAELDSSIFPIILNIGKPLLGGLSIYTALPFSCRNSPALETSLRSHRRTAAPWSGPYTSLAVLDLLVKPRCDHMLVEMAFFLKPTPSGYSMFIRRDIYKLYIDGFVYIFL